jgi:hypothetical protein
MQVYTTMERGQWLTVVWMGQEVRQETQSNHGDVGSTRDCHLTRREV